MLNTVDDVIKKCLDDHTNWLENGKVPSEDLEQLLKCIVQNAHSSKIDLPADILDKVNQKIKERGLTVGPNSRIHDLNPRKKP